jgi:ketosteroid isomerase-like protein
MAIGETGSWSGDFAQTFAEEWVDAWNAHDIERVLAHYADDVELYSPFIVSIAHEPRGRLVGKAAVRAYWSTAVSSIKDLHFELLDVLVGVDSLTIYYKGHRGTVAEVLFFDNARRVTLATACYSASDVVKHRAGSG